MGITEKLLGGFLTAHLNNPALHWMLMASAIIIACVTVGVFATKVIETPCLALRDKWFPSRGRAIALPQLQIEAHELKEVDDGIRVGTISSPTSVKASIKEQAPECTPVPTATNDFPAPNGLGKASTG